MRKIGFIRFKNTTKEVLPKTYKVNEISCRRRMFCTMINQYLSNKSQLYLKNSYMFEHKLLHIFEDKILSFFQFYRFKPEKTQKIVKIYTHDSLLINQYFKQSKNYKMKYLSKVVHFNQKFKFLYGYAHPSIELIGLIFNGKEIKMMLDLNEIFTKTIFNRIKKEENKTVTLDMPYIHISQNGVTTRLHPRWKHINPKNLEDRSSDINDGFTQLKDEDIDQCYLVYPKTDGFKRHIILKGESQELKMIPYSFTFANKEKNICLK